jgi:hypothetical protein
MSTELVAGGSGISVMTVMTLSVHDILRSTACAPRQTGCCVCQDTKNFFAEGLQRIALQDHVVGTSA